MKHVVTAIPIYSMAAGKIPLGICDEVEKVVRAFLWRGDGNKKKGWTSVAWKNICKPKQCGGLGIRRINAMNSVMLGKIGWTLANEPEKLWVKALKAKYFPFSSFMKCRKKKICFQIWPAVLSSRNSLEKGLCYREGRGNNINIWEDPWLPDTPGSKPTPKNERMIRR